MITTEKSETNRVIYLIAHGRNLPPWFLGGVKVEEGNSDLRSLPGIG